MTTTDTGASIDPPLAEDHDGDVAPPTRRRRRPAPRAHPFWRFVFPVLVVAAGVAVFFVWRAGTKAVLDSTDGQQVVVVSDPAAPGYVAFVDPTPTMLVVHTADDELVGVSVLARTALDAGGTLVLLSADMLMQPDDNRDNDVLLGRAYDRGGIGEVEELVAGLFGFGFHETQELDEDALAQFLGLVEPIPFGTADALVAVDDAGAITELLPAGLHDLDGATAAEVYGWRNPGEFESNRRERQLDLWLAWLQQIGRADDLLAATLPFDDGLPRYLRSLGAGTADVSLVPLEPFYVGDALPLYYLDEAGHDWLAAKAADMVPLPIGSTAGARSSVRLLDGTGETRVRDRMLPILVAAGAEISIIGNAPAFDVADTVVAYHIAENQLAAEDLAATIGAAVRFDADPNQPIDLTVIVGADQEA